MKPQPDAYIIQRVSGVHRLTTYTPVIVIRTTTKTTVVTDEHGNETTFNGTKETVRGNLVERGVGMFGKSLSFDIKKCLSDMAEIKKEQALWNQFQAVKEPLERRLSALIERARGCYDEEATDRLDKCLTLLATETSMERTSREEHEAWKKNRDEEKARREASKSS